MRLRDQQRRSATGDDKTHWCKNEDDLLYVFSLVVLSSLLAIVLVPAGLALAGRYIDVAAELDPLLVAPVIAKSFLGPLMRGLVLRALFPTVGKRLADRLMSVVGIALAPSAVAQVAALSIGAADGPMNAISMHSRR